MADIVADFGRVSLGILIFSVAAAEAGKEQYGKSRTCINAGPFAGNTQSMAIPLAPNGIKVFFNGVS